jgi:hypothetical protein
MVLPIGPLSIHQQPEPFIEGELTHSGLLLLFTVGIGHSGKFHRP